MNSPLFIARRYFFSWKKKMFIHILSLLTMVVLIASAASMMIVLSGFNGMEDVMRKLFHSFDAELRMEPIKGKTFVYDDEFKAKINKIEGVESYSDIIEENALMLYKGQILMLSDYTL